MYMQPPTRSIETFHVDIYIDDTFWGAERRGKIPSPLRVGSCSHFFLSTRPNKHQQLAPRIETHMHVDFASTTPIITTPTTTTTTRTGVNATPAPTTTALGTGTEDSESLGFEDNPMTLAGGEAVALGALGLFALLTFTAL